MVLGMTATKRGGSKAASLPAEKGRTPVTRAMGEYSMPDTDCQAIMSTYFADFPAFFVGIG